MKSKGNKILVVFEDNWADEMDIRMFTICSPEESDEFQKRLKSYKENVCMYFGSNEENEYNNGQELLSNFKFYAITPEEEKVLRKFFDIGYNELCLDNICEEDEEEYGEEDDE